jgi:hypothetical protein
MLAGVNACKGGWIVAKTASWPCSETPCLAICTVILTKEPVVLD